MSSKHKVQRANTRLFVYVLMVMLTLLASGTTNMASASEIEDYSAHGTAFVDWDDDEFFEDFNSLQNRNQFRHLTTISTDEFTYDSEAHIQPKIRKISNGGRVYIHFDEDIAFPDNFVD